MKGVAKKVAIALLPMYFVMILLILLIGSVAGVGSTIQAPTDELHCYYYQYTGYRLGVNWELPLLVDMFMAAKEGKQVEDYNYLFTALNFTNLQVDVYTQEDDYDEDGNLIGSSWEYSYTEYYFGADEILNYLGISSTEKNVDVVINTIESINGDEYQVSLIVNYDYETVLNTYYTDLDDIEKKDILALESEHYFAQLYGQMFEAEIVEIYLGDIIIAPNGMQIPLYYQYAGGWHNIPFGGGTISSSGCSVTSIAMVFTYLIDETITPDQIVAWTGNRYYVEPAGQSWAIFPACASRWGVTCQDLGMSTQAVIEALSQGKPVIASMKPGTFTRAGHFIVLRGITSSGKILVNDPNDSAAKNFVNQEFDINLIVREAKNFWSFTN